MAERTTTLGSWPGGRILVLSPTPTHPQDYGNRKRIFQVCRRFAGEGARITFLHYPAESEWRSALPLSAERAMRAEWHQYYTIAPTKYLHGKPAGHHHLIDEWWDDAIGHFLRWLFSVQSFDAFIVNYSWLSKAFEFAPKSTFKILDTHDKMSGRREVLASLGLHPEFFYTTEEEESIALQRANLVWAIKNEERALFEHMAATPVLTLPHLDPPRALEQPDADPEGFLRVGVIGARNNVNRMNILEFLAAAEPVFLETFAPVKIVIAGSICDLLGDLKYPFVELRGRMEQVEDFYRSVDCIAVPMRSSTGLKIKTGEALSMGKPLVSLAHAFEGYESANPMHGLRNFEQMARALADLAFAPREKLNSLADASRASHARTSALIAATYKSSDLRAREVARSIVLAVDSRAFVAGSIFNLSLVAMQEYLRDLANVTILVVKGSASDVLGNRGAIDLLRRVIVADDVVGARDTRDALLEIGANVFDAEDYLRLALPKIVVADALHPALCRRVLPDATIVSRAEMIAYSQGDTAFRLPAWGYQRSFVAAPRMSRDAAAMAASTGAAPLLARCFCRPPKFKVSRVHESGSTRSLAILGSLGAPAVRTAVAMARAWKMQPHIVFGLGDDAGDLPEETSVSHSADQYVSSILEGRTAVPFAAIDLSGGRLGLSLCREVLELLHVPLATAATAALHPSLGLRQTPYLVATEGELWRTIRTFAQESDAALERMFIAVRHDIDGDRDWHWLWRFANGVFAATGARAAA